MGHSYYSYTKEELVGNGPKLPVIVMEDNAEVFHSMAVEMVDEIRKHNEKGEKNSIYLSCRSCRTVSIFCGYG